MQKLRVWLAMAALLVVLAACARPPQPTPTAQVEQPTVPAASPSPEVTAVAQVDYCVECHTDQDSLIETAKPEEVVVEESEGAG